MEEMENHRQEFERYRQSGNYEGQVLPKSQLDRMNERFDNITTWADSTIKKMTCEELQYRLLSILAASVLKLNTWTGKCDSSQEVATNQADYQVFQLSVDTLL